MRVAFERIKVKLDYGYHRPPAFRKTIPNSRALLAELGGSDPAALQSFLQDLADSRLLERIESSIRSSLPSDLALRPGIRESWLSISEGWLEVLTALYVHIRATRPKSVLETGVGIVGASSAFILQGLSDNRVGRLYSVDAGRFLQVYGIPSGSGIPENLRAKHTIVIGRSRTRLKPLLQSLGKIGFFLHDSSHTYGNMMWEYTSAWPYLPENTILASDDTDNCALDRFAEQRGAFPIFYPYGESTFGFVRKRSFGLV